MRIQVFPRLHRSRPECSPAIVALHPSSGAPAPLWNDNGAGDSAVAPSGSSELVKACCGELKAFAAKSSRASRCVLRDVVLRDVVLRGFVLRLGFIAVSYASRPRSR